MAGCPYYSDVFRYLWKWKNAAAREYLLWLPHSFYRSVSMIAEAFAGPGGKCAVCFAHCAAGFIIQHRFHPLCRVYFLRENPGRQTGRRFR